MNTSVKAGRKPMRAGQMTVILIAMIAVLICLLIGGSVLAASILLKKSTDATHAQIDADVSASDSSRLEALKDYLAKNATGIKQTESLTANLGKYDQNSIVATISGYANKSGVSITSFDFGSSMASPATTTPAVSNAGTVSVTLGSPVSYQKFIVFLQLLEKGLMPAQVTGASISSSPDAPGTVTISSLTIQVAQ